MDNEDSDQTERMRKIILVLVVRTCQKVRFITFRMISPKKTMDVNGDVIKTVT